MFDELSDVTIRKKNDYDHDNRSTELCQGAMGVSQPLKDFNSQVSIE